MFKHAISTVLAIAIAGPLAAHRTDQFRAGTPAVLQAQQLPETRIIDYTFVFAAAPESAAPEPALLTEIATWLAANFDLPTSDLLPKIKFATPGKIAAIYYGGLLNGQQLAAGNDPATLSVGSEIMAVYDTNTQTIFLPEGWRGTHFGEAEGGVANLSSAATRMSGSLP